MLHELQDVKLDKYTEYRWISADAIGMYSNMNIDDTIKTIKAYLKEVVLKNKINFNTELLIMLAEIVLCYNMFMFGDLYLKQTSGIAMGTIAAVMLANIYVAYNKEIKILPKYKQLTKLY